MRPSDVRKIIERRRKQLGLSRYRLARHHGVKAQPETVERWLGARGSDNLRSDTLLQLIQAVGLEVRLEPEEAGRGTGAKRPRGRTAAHSVA